MRRDRWMASQGIEVLRLTGKQVDLETEAVLDTIDAAPEMRTAKGRKPR